MRRLLLAAAATAPLALCVTPAAAQTTTISSSTSTPVATSTAAGGAPSDVDVAGGGTVTSPNTTPGVTLDSNNNVTVEGAVTSDNVNNATGVLLLGGHTGSFTSTGTISVVEDYAASDSANSDGLLEAPYASGSGRYGVRLTGADPLNGSVSLTGANTVKGNSSYVVSLEAPLTGSLAIAGTTTLTGDNGVAVQELAGVGGSVTVGGATSVLGQNTRAVLIGGSVGGSVSFLSSIVGTGYTASARQTDPVQQKIQATPTDVEQGGPVVTIAADVAHGVYFSGPPAATVAGTLADADGDGVADGAETTATVTSYGASPALLIGAPDKAITLGAFGTGDNAYGLLVRGTISASNLIDSSPAVALQIGAGAQGVTLVGGARIVGAVSASAYEADALAVHVLSQAVVPSFVVNGTVSSSILDSTLITTPTAATSTAILVDAGATLTSLTNTGSISATAVGDAMNTAAIIDRSGKLSTVLNEGVITSAVTPNAAGDRLTGTKVALDLSANTTGVTLTQQTNPNPNTLYGSTSGTTDVASTSVTATSPEIVGDVYLGSGPNTVNLLAGGLVGALALGSAEGSSLTIGEGALFSGPLTYGGGSLSLNLAAGTLDDTSATTLHLATLNIGATSKLVVALDGATGAATRLVSSGPANIEAGATFGVNILSAPTAASSSYVVISAPTLTYGGAAGTVAASASYLFDANFTIDPAAGNVTLNVARRSQAELGLTNSEYGSLNGVLSGLAANPNLLQAVLLPTDKAAFTAVYDELLPDHAGGVFLAAQSAAESIGHAALDARSMDFAPGAWVQEFAIGVEQDREQAVASQAGGFGVAGGVETGASALGQFGVTASFANATIKDPDVATDSQASFSELEAGLYWRADYGGLQLAGRVGGGYLFGYDRRYISLSATDTTSAVSTADKGTWNGWTVDGRISAGYQIDLGKRWFVRPQLVGEYFRLDQDSYTEKGGGNGVDLAVDSRSGDASTGTASLVFGAKFGRSIIWRPSIELGARDVFSGDAGDTTARFVSGGDSFTLVPNQITGVGGMARVGLKVGGASYEIYFDAEGQEFAHYRSGDVRTGVRVLF